STGTPKGVLQKHATILNLIDHMERNMPVTTKNVLQLSSFNFDVSVQEILFTLTSGRTLFVTSQAVKRNIKSLCRFIISNDVEVIFLTPSLFAEIANTANSKDYFFKQLKLVYLA